MALILNAHGLLDAEQTQEHTTTDHNKEAAQLNAA